MNVLIAGHKYELQNLTPDIKIPDSKAPQVLRFIQKTPSSVDRSLLVITQNGTSTEEVLDALIDRIAVCNEMCHCKENDRILENLMIARFWCDARTNDREQRRVKGKNVV